MKFLYKFRFLILRRLSVFSILLLYLLASYSSFDLLSGDLSASKIFGVIPLSDPYAFLQLLLAGGALSMNLVLGVLIVLFIYGVFMGRGFCAFVCPVNLATDLGRTVRKILSRKFFYTSKTMPISRRAKFYVLALGLLLSFAFSTLAYEYISPTNLTVRAVVFGAYFGFVSFASVVVLEILYSNSFCSSLCPLGATYEIVGHFSILRIKHNASNCTMCNRCFDVCPEPQVLDMIGEESIEVRDNACIKCGRCVEVCDDKALKFTFVNQIKNRRKK